MNITEVFRKKSMSVSELYQTLVRDWDEEEGYQDHNGDYVVRFVLGENSVSFNFAQRADDPHSAQLLGTKLHLFTQKENSAPQKKGMWRDWEAEVDFCERELRERLRYGGNIPGSIPAYASEAAIQATATRIKNSVVCEKFKNE